MQALLTSQQYSRSKVHRWPLSPELCLAPRYRDRGRRPKAGPDFLRIRPSVVARADDPWLRPECRTVVLGPAGGQACLQRGDRRSEDLAHQEVGPQCFGGDPPVGEIIVALALILLLGYFPLLVLIVRDAIDFDLRQSKASARTRDLAGGVEPSIRERRGGIAQLVEVGHSPPEAADTLGGDHLAIAPDVAISSENDGVEPSPESPDSSHAAASAQTDQEDVSLTSADDDKAATVISATVKHEDDVLPAESLVPDLTLDDDETRFDNMDTPGVRDAIASEIELEISKAVKAVPGCEDFRGVIVAFARSNSHSNWDVHGIRFGKAERAIASDTIATVVTRLQQKFALVEAK